MSRWRRSRSARARGGGDLDGRGSWQLTRERRFAVQGPYNLALSLASSQRYTEVSRGDESVFRTAVRVDGEPSIMEVSQVDDDPPVLAVAGTGGAPPGSLQQEAEWMLFGGLSLKPFYERVTGHQVMEGAVRRLRGLKPSRPPSLFEMAVTAVTEQQISMAAAYRIRTRLVEAFGDRILTVSEKGEPSYHAFPDPERLASASKDSLRQCGLSGRKAEYILGLARRVVSGEIDLERLRDFSDEEVRAVITDLRGFGPWSADYILVRGLGRLDCVPASDLGVRTVVGDLLGDGSRMGAEDVRATLAPFEPHRGLAAFYLLRYADVHSGSSR